MTSRHFVAAAARRRGPAWSQTTTSHSYTSRTISSVQCSSVSQEIRLTSPKGRMYSMDTVEPSTVIKNPKICGFQCEVCQAVFASKRTLTYHKGKKHSNGDYTCDICGISIKSDIALVFHKKIHLLDKEEMQAKYHNPIYECSVCDLQTRSPTGLVLHSIEAHPLNEGLFDRKKTKQKVNRKIAIAYRYDDNNNAIPHKLPIIDQVKCPLCFVCYAENRIRGHFLTAHPFQKSVFCTHCAAIIEDPKEMWEHLKEHSPGEDLHQCKFCNWVFISGPALAAHMRFHTCQRPFSCSVCLKEFQSKTAAMAHFHSHLKIEMIRNKSQPDSSPIGKVEMLEGANHEMNSQMREEELKDFVNVCD